MRQYHVSFDTTDGILTGVDDASIAEPNIMLYDRDATVRGQSWPSYMLTVRDCACPGPCPDDCEDCS